jgi:hypothetical protein
MRRRPKIDFLRGAKLLDPPVLHHRDPVRQAQSLPLIVGDEDEGAADDAMDAAQLFLHGLAQFQIERRQRLVKQKHLRIHHERARQCNPLLLSAGQLRRHMVLEAVETHQRHGVADLL